jgi:predicted metalloendopeptidase
MKRVPTVPFPLLHIRPGDDFYKHVNGKWLKTVKTPPFLSYYGVSEEIEEIIRNQQIKLVKDCIRSFQKSPDNSLCNKIARFGLSSLRPNVQNESINLLKKMLKMLIIHYMMLKICTKS